MIGKATLNFVVAKLICNLLECEKSNIDAIYINNPIYYAFNLYPYIKPCPKLSLLNIKLYCTNNLKFLFICF